MMADLIINWTAALGISAAGCIAYVLVNLLSIHLEPAEVGDE